MAMLALYLKSYQESSEQYGPNTAVLLQIGSFYELCDVPEGKTNMQRVAELLGLQVATKQGKGAAAAAGETLMAGFPEQSLHKYAGMLTRRGWTVVVVEQQKDVRGAVVRRESTRILSPGTHIEAAETEAVWVGGLLLEEGGWGSREPPRFAAVVLDLTTGDVVQYGGTTSGKEESWSADPLVHFFQVHPPRELSVWWKGAGGGLPSEDRLRRATGCPRALLHRSVLPVKSGLQEATVREGLFRRAFQPASMLPILELVGCKEELQALCLAQLLLFAEDHCPSAMRQLHLPRTWSPETGVFLGNNALTQLNFLTAQESDSVLGLFLGTATAFGQRAMRRRLLVPSSDSELLERRLSQIAWTLETGSNKAKELTVLLRQIKDLPRLHRAITMGSLTAAEVLALDQSYSYASTLASSVASGPLAASESLVREMGELAEKLQKVFDMEKARGASEDQSFLKGVPAVETLETSIRESRGKLQELVEGFHKAAGLPSDSLKLELRDSGVVLQGSKTVLTALANRIKGGRGFEEKFGSVELSIKKSGGTVEIGALQGVVRGLIRLQEELREAVASAIRPVCDELAGTYLRTWDSLEEWLAAVDCTVTLARVSAAHGFCRPQILEGSADSEVSLQGLRHPLIEAQRNQVEYVKHDVALGCGSCPESSAGWLVYGMNASGKSSLMKSVGIAVVLAQTGCYVPATACTIRPFRSVFTRILNTDNLWAGLSSFAVEMTELREILQRADAHSLVLGDELCSGTESMSATALVGAALEWLTKRKSRFMFATHFHGLAELPSVMSLPSLRIWHLRVRYDAAADRLVYERTLQPGAGSSLYGLEVAKAMAVPFEVLETAHRLRRELLGTATEETAPRSAWNSTVQRRSCELCGSEKVRELEVHHREERATANAEGRLADGTSMNARRNLVVLCEACHDKHHAGHIEVGPVEQTSSGPVRKVDEESILSLSSYSYKPRGLTEEQIETVQSYLRKYPNCPPKRLLFDLKEKEGIAITLQKLKALRL